MACLWPSSRMKRPENISGLACDVFHGAGEDKGGWTDFMCNREAQPEARSIFKITRRCTGKVGEPNASTRENVSDHFWGYLIVHRSQALEAIRGMGFGLSFFYFV
ncbi:hypothetical protein V5O48_010002 [Marasmius crinis-equi]|uniref:Uncharacterized protein n=1 Tax=Marasmius crinis-equi TaxID=585013 RepID=A0ABR3F9R5_9AGAR